MTKAKLALTTILLTALLTLIGCNSTSSQTEIVGKWEQTSSGTFLPFIAEQLEFHEDGKFYAPGKWSGTYALLDEHTLQLKAKLTNSTLESTTYTISLTDDSLRLSDIDSGITLEFKRTGPPSEALPPTLHPSASSTLPP